MFWKVLEELSYKKKITGYKVISQTGETKVVSPQELYNAIMNKGIVNATFENNRIKIIGDYKKVIDPPKVNIPFTEEELKALEPYLDSILNKAVRNKDKNLSQIQSAISHLGQALLLFSK